MIKIFILFLFLIQLNPLTAFEKDNIDDAYILIKSKNLTDDFFLIKYDFYEEEIYLGLNTLFYFLELYTIQVDLENKSVLGVFGDKEVSTIFTSENSFVMQGDLFVSPRAISENLPFSNITWSNETLTLNITPTFQLPYEVRNQSELNRLQLSSDKEENKFDIISPHSSLISPGFLKFSYYNHDLTNSDTSSFKLEYGTQLLFGDFYLSQELSPDPTLETYKLTYNNIYEENDLSFGHFFLKVPDFFNVSSYIEGVSFGDDNIYSSLEGDTIIIEGEAQGADIIEIYQDDILIDFLIPTDNNFKFEVKDRGYSSEYNIKIYYNNGQIEDRIIQASNNFYLLKENQTKYNFQYGSFEGSKQSVAEINHGITNNFSINLGLLNLISDIKTEYNIVKSGFSYKLPLLSSSISTNFSLFYDYKENEDAYTFSVEKEIKDFKLFFKHDNYSNYFNKDYHLNKSFELGLIKRFSDQSFSLGVLEESFFQNNRKERGIFLTYENKKIGNYAFFIDQEYKYNNQRNHIIEINPGFTYSGFDFLTLLAEVDFRNESAANTLDYSVRALGRRKKFNDSLDYNFNFGVKYNEVDHFSFTFDIMVYFDNLFYIETPFKYEEDGTYYLGANIEKTFDLSNPIKNIKNSSVENSWIEGRVFIDSNNNGIFDSNETILADVDVIIENKIFKTNSKGIYSSDGLIPNQSYRVILDSKSIDPMLKQVNNKVKISTKPSMKSKFDIPVQAISMITGNILQDSSISSSDFLQILTFSKIKLFKNDKLYKEIDPEFDGLFFFDDILPGEYILNFNYLGSKYIHFTTNNIPVTIFLQNDDEGEYFEGFDTIIKGVQR